MKKILLAMVIVSALISPLEALAENEAGYENVDVIESLYQAGYDSLGSQEIEEFISQLNRETSEYLPPLNFKTMVDMFKSGQSAYSASYFFKGIFRYFLNDVLLNTKLLGQLVILTVICAVLQNLERAFDGDRISSLAYYACFLVLIIIVVKSFSLAVDIGRDTINRMVDFMLALIPTLLALLVSVGGVTSAVVFDPIIMFTVQVISNIVRDFILPIIFLTSILSIVNNLSETFQVSRLSGLLKQVCIWTLGFILTIFIGIITIRGTTAQTLDQVTLKAAKFAVDSFIPVVGKCLSDAVSTIAGYSLILKDAVSTVGLIAFVIICTFPLIKIISMIFIYKLSSALIEPISDKRITNCLNEIGNSLILIFASILCVGVMFFIMVTIIASTGKLAVMGS